MSAKEKNNGKGLNLTPKDKSIAAGTAVATGAAGLTLAGIRKSYQSRVDPNAISIYGGTDQNLWPEGSLRYNNVFDTQRKA